MNLDHWVGQIYGGLAFKSSIGDGRLQQGRAFTTCLSVLLGHFSTSTLHPACAPRDAFNSLRLASTEGIERAVVILSRRSICCVRERERERERCLTWTTEKTAQTTQEVQVEFGEDLTPPTHDPSHGWICDPMRRDVARRCSVGVALVRPSGLCCETG